MGDLCGFASQQQRLCVHIHLRCLPTGSTPGKGLTVPVTVGLVGPPGSVKTSRGWQLETDDGLDLAEGGSPLPGDKTAQVNIKSLILTGLGTIRPRLLPCPSVLHCVR